MGSTALINPVTAAFIFPFPHVEKSQGCDRFNLMVAVALWKRKLYGSEVPFQQRYMLQLQEAEFQRRVRRTCWWRLRVAASFRASDGSNERDAPVTCDINCRLHRSIDSVNLFVGMRELRRPMISFELL